jgi:hypothetical protein
MANRRIRSRLLAGMAMTATLTVASAGFVGVQAASAAPYNCDKGGLGNVGWVICNSGVGSYQAVVSCDRIGPDYTRTGAWMAVGSGERSTAACDSSHGAYNRRFNVFGPI